jgi:hypothetical protein
MRASTSRPDESSPSATTAVEHGPMPGSSTAPAAPPAASSTSCAAGTRPRGKPTDAMTEPARTIAPSSASSASAARSIASIVATFSSPLAETAARNSVSW